MFLEVIKGRIIWRQHCPSHDLCNKNLYSVILKRYCECNWGISLLHLDLGMYGMPASRKKVAMATHIGVKDNRKKEEIKEGRRKKENNHHLRGVRTRIDS